MIASVTIDLTITVDERPVPVPCRTSWPSKCYCYFYYSNDNLLIVGLKKNYFLYLSIFYILHFVLLKKKTMSPS